MGHDVITGDCLEFFSAYRGPKFHAVLCDPPYHLTSIVKRFGSSNSAPAKSKKTGAYARHSAGFLGQQWDGGDIAFKTETWAAIAGLLHPGAFLFAFAGSRGYHRMATAIENAGLIIHPAIGWVFGSGFPKATHVKNDHRFLGHRYGLQALKPALEFISVAQLPYDGRPVDNISGTGAGALNIDGERIPRNDASSPGRWPANLVFGHSADCNESECADDCAIKMLGNQNGNRDHDDSGTAARFFHNIDHKLEAHDPIFYAAKANGTERDAGLGDFKPDVKRMYTNSNWSGEERWRGGSLPVLRNRHPTVKPLKLTRHLAGLLLPPAEYSPRRILVPFAGSGSEMIGAALAGWDEIVGIEQNPEYAAIARARLDYWMRAKVRLF